MRTRTRACSPPSRTRPTWSCTSSPSASSRYQPQPQSCRDHAEVSPTLHDHGSLRGFLHQTGVGMVSAQASPTAVTDETVLVAQKLTKHFPVQIGRAHV